MDEDETQDEGCECEDCEIDRRRGCDAPEKCQKAAERLLEALHPLWRPKIHSEDDTSDEEGTERNTGAYRHANETPERQTLTESFRVFTSNLPPPSYDTRKTNSSHSRRTVVVYTDGSCTNAGYEEAKAGAGVWYGKDDTRNKALRVPSDLPQTNNTAEAAAVLVAIQSSRSRDTLIIRTDSKYVIDAVGGNRRKIEDTDWLGQSNRNILEPIIARIRQRKGRTIFEKVKGHSGDEGNDGADALAAEGAEKATGEELDLSVPRSWKVKGAALGSMTQALLYKGIRRLKRDGTKDRRRTVMGLDATRYASKEKTGLAPLDETVWKSMKSKHLLDNKLRVFLWKIVHDALGCGSFWENIEKYKERARCPTCGITETAEHTLTECPSTGQKVIWNLVRKVFEMKGIEWAKPTPGSIASCGTRSILNPTTGKPKTGASRLYTIIISQSAYLIWKLRCEWRIGKQGEKEGVPTDLEVHNRWVAMINRIIKLDALAARKRPREKEKRTGPCPVLFANTWKDVLLDNEVVAELHRQFIAMSKRHQSADVRSRG
ncbi:hypothetical protein DFP72DRAFT_815935 [Ephemerocybe angulata]|uniref:ribonuclease H n=1 Tax=Ephemerocybe angulata TaxID=980116 RepID=A0A8H6HSC9_9AGAR|nr:hypothetical protein DFP72DRAFT_815935 [Tulosesus angulatus]